MTTLTLSLLLLATVLGGVAWQAWRMRSEARDVWLIGASSGATGLGAAVAHWL